MESLLLNDYIENIACNRTEVCKISERKWYAIATFSTNLYIFI
jgi:hypothetical protein